MPFVMKARNEEPRPEIPLTPEEAEVARIVRTATGDLSSAATTSVVRDALAARNYEAIVQAFPWEQTAETLGLTTPIFEQAIASGLGTGFPSVGFKGRFDYTDPRTLDWAKAQSAQLVTAVTNNTRQIIRSVVADAFTKGYTPQETAQILSNFVGLNNRQAISYEKFVNNLDEQVRAGNLTVAQMRKMTDRQYKKMIKYRSQMIARQEIAMAEAEGRYLGFTQAIEQGWAHPKSMKRWSASSDERTCEICGPMNGKSVQWDQPFPNGVFREPAHIMCRCTTSLLDPESKLAQDFMPPSPIVPEQNLVPMPEKATAAVVGLRDMGTAVTDAHTRASGVSHFQYDAGEIENLDVTVESVTMNGAPATEVRVKLTEDAKNRLVAEAEKGVRDGTWTKETHVLIDKKTGREITIHSTTDPTPNGSQPYYRVKDALEDKDPFFKYVGADEGATYTTYRPDGTIIRFTVGGQRSFAFDGQVRAFIPGEAKPKQLETVFKALKVKANRYPSAADIEALKTNRVISLFKPEVKGATPAMKEKYVKDIAKKWGFSLDDISTTFDGTGRMTLELPERVADKIKKETGVKAVQHRLSTFGMKPHAATGGMTRKTAEELEDSIMQLLTKPRLESTVSRVATGNAGRGISMATDIQTGGADFVFTSPVKGELLEAGQRSSFIIEWDSSTVLRRMDWFAAADDSYGVVNPAMRTYWNGKTSFSNPDWIAELTGARDGGEVMFRDSLDIGLARRFSVPQGFKENIISRLRALGYTDWNGLPLEEFIVESGGGFW